MEIWKGKGKEEEEGEKRWLKQRGEGRKIKEEEYEGL